MVDKTAKFWTIKRKILGGAAGLYGAGKLKRGIATPPKRKIDPSTYSGHLAANVIAGKIPYQNLSPKEMGMVRSHGFGKHACYMMESTKYEMEKIAAVPLFGVAAKGLSGAAKNIFRGIGFGGKAKGGFASGVGKTKKPKGPKSLAGRLITPAMIIPGDYSEAAKQYSGAAGGTLGHSPVRRGMIQRPVRSIGRAGMMQNRQF